MARMWGESLSDGIVAVSRVLSRKGNGRKWGESLGDRIVTAHRILSQGGRVNNIL